MELSKYIDHTNLNKNATLKDIEKLCNEAIKYKFTSVCVYPYYVPLAHELLKEKNIDVCTTISGESTKETKAFESINAIENGASEIDMMINISALKNKDYDYIMEEIEEIRDSIDGKVLKVSVDIKLINDEELTKLVEICNNTYINFINLIIDNNCSDINKYIKLINDNKNELLEIKISGTFDIKTIESIIDLGVTRIGTAISSDIMECDCEDHYHEK